MMRPRSTTEADEPLEGVDEPLASVDEPVEAFDEPFVSDRPRRRGLIDVLRFVGLARRPIPRPVVGKKAYVRWWERLRAAILLTAIVIGLGFVLAAIIGIAVLGAGFLLEQAIS